MQEVNICSCGHHKQSHYRQASAWVEDEPCWSSVFLPLSELMLDCGCMEFKADNLKYLESLTNEC